MRGSGVGGGGERVGYGKKEGGKEGEREGGREGGRESVCVEDRKGEKNKNRNLKTVSNKN